MSNDHMSAEERVARIIASEYDDTENTWERWLKIARRIAPAVANDALEEAADWLDQQEDEPDMANVVRSFKHRSDEPQTSGALRSAESADVTPNPWTDPRNNGDFS